MIEFFADIGSNWIYNNKTKGKSFDRAMRLIKYAADSGCTGVKFQYFKAEQLWSDKMKMEQAIARYRELPFDWLESLSKYAHKNELLFGLSVFDVESVEKVNPYVDYFKIASFEVGWFKLVNACYKTGKRLMISLGQVNKNEILEIIAKLPSGQTNQIDLLHCVSKYPTKLEDCNLNIIKNNLIINGYSDHTVNRSAIYAAVGLGAKVIEVHLDDGLGLEKDHSWTPWLVNDLIYIVRDMQTAMGSGNWDEVAKQQDRTYKADSKTGLRGGQE